MAKPTPVVPLNNKEYFPLPNKLAEMIEKNYDLQEQYNCLVKE